MNIAQAKDIVEVRGAETVRQIMAVAPKQFQKQMRMWFYRERASFVGDKRRDGSFRKALMRKKLGGGRTGTWPDNVAKSFKGYIEGGEKIENMTLHMGVGFRHGNAFTQGLAQMEDGYTRQSSALMPVPVYKNLLSVGVASGFTKKFKQMLSAGQLDVVKSSGKVLFFLKGHRWEDGGLLWTGAERVTVKPQFTFVQSWEARKPAVMVRGEKVIERTLRAVEKGYLKGI